MEKSHFEQAKLWLNGAKYISAEDAGTNRYAVAVAMAVHAIIKANDALTFKFMNITARRHDDARRLCTKMSPNIFVWGLKPRPLGRHFWHPKNPLSKENSVKPAPLGAGRSFLWVFMI